MAPITAIALAHALIMDKQYEQAIQVLSAGISQYPNLGLSHAELGKAYLLSGKNSEAVKELETANRLDPNLVIRKGELGYVYGRAGRKDDALKILNSLEERTKTENISATAVSQIYMGLGDLPKALDALKIAVSTHDIALVTSLNPLVDPVFDPIRSDPKYKPQFDQILRGMNLIRQ
jgi:tetratricopeptide (TPR) repeat protein